MGALDAPALSPKAGRALASQQLSDILAATDRARSAGRSARDQVDAPGFVEAFTDMSGWGPTSLVASGGQVTPQTGGGNGAGANRTVSIPVGGVMRMRAKILLAAGSAGTGASVLIGVSKAAAASAYDGPNTIAIGVRENLVPIAYRGTGVGGTGATDLGASLGAGTFYVTVVVDETSISLALCSASGYTELSFSILRSAFGSTIPHLTIYCNDTRGSGGNKITGLGFKAATVTLPTSSGLENVSPSPARMLDASGQTVRVALPPSYDARVPAPVVIYCHGNGQSAQSIVGAAAPLAVQKSLLDAGFIVAAHDQHGNNWGSDQAVDDLVATYRYIRDKYALGPVVLLGESMGGLSSQRAIIDRRIPVVGWAGLYPVCDLRWMYDNLDAAAIRTAHGIASDGSDYATKTEGRNPILAPPDAFRGLPMRFYVSPGDTRVPRVNHGDPQAARLASFAKECAVVTASGEHGDASHWQGTDLAAFFGRCVSI